MAYRSEDRRDRWKAISAVLLVHVVLGAVILSGLNVNIVRGAVERLETFDVSLPEVPPPPPPPPRKARDAQGAPAAPEASPVVAPEPEIDVPTRNPVAAAPEPGEGASSSAGRGGVGSGTGAGGTGTGAGRGSGEGFTPARITRRIPNSEYRRISAGRVPTGSATIRFIVTPQGRLANCRVVRSSGDSGVDSVLCRVAEARMRFAPARDPSGKPVAQDMAYTPTWRPR